MNKYDKFVLSYLIDYPIITTAVEIARADNNEYNRILYSNSLKKLTKSGEIKKTEKGWILNDGGEVLNDPIWGKLFKSNPDIIDIIFSKKKMTFLDWWSIFQKMMMNKSVKKVHINIVKRKSKKYYKKNKG